MTDIVIGFAANFDWPALEPFAVSLVRSGFAGKKVLFVQGLTQDAMDNLIALGFELNPIPMIQYSYSELAQGDFFAYVARFLLIHQYLFDRPGFRYVVCADTRDVIFQHDPMKWLEDHIGHNLRGIVAASEFIRHEDQEGNTTWINQGFKEIANWLLPHVVYCSGLISGRAEYISDLALAIYLMGRHISGSIWGVDQPAYNAIMHQKAYEDITLVPTMTDQYCLNMVVLAFEKYREKMLELPPVAALTSINLPGYTLPDLSGFTILHQYDRIPPLAAALRAKYTLANLRK